MFLANDYWLAPSFICTIIYRIGYFRFRFMAICWWPLDNRHQKQCARTFLFVVRGRRRRRYGCRCAFIFVVVWKAVPKRDTGAVNVTINLDQTRRDAQRQTHGRTCAKVSNGHVKLFGPYRSEVRSQLPPEHFISNSHHHHHHHWQRIVNIVNTINQCPTHSMSAHLIVLIGWILLFI